ncbi:MAG: phytanoyl-CoA dioxygenase family protein [Myxococcales bacterium]|nr:phytanoyl-CoA dioxygenase family protein [Myxococcales bacterium]MCB9626995.1 phytanoyl-CoA dioxygenase family protein [Sandaracinaceae bacterium]
MLVPELDEVELGRRWDSEGCVLLRQALSKASVAAARDAMHGFLLRAANVPGTADDAARAVTETHNRIHNSPTAAPPAPIAALRDDPALAKIAHVLLGGPVAPLSVVWLRARGARDFQRTSSPHCDAPYVGGHTDGFCTFWIPLQPVSAADGTMIVMPRSHKSARLAAYAGSDLLGGDGALRMGAGYCHHPDDASADLQLPWWTAEFEVGDILAFRPNLLHAAVDNMGQQLRCSVDVRLARRELSAPGFWSSPAPVDFDGYFMDAQ